MASAILDVATERERRAAGGRDLGGDVARRPPRPVWRKPTATDAPRRPSSSAIARPMPRDPPVTRQALPVRSAMAKPSCDLAETERRWPARSPATCGGRQRSRQRLVGSVAFAAALTVDCQLSSVACCVRLTISWNCSTACPIALHAQVEQAQPGLDRGILCLECCLEDRLALGGPGARAGRGR